MSVDSQIRLEDGDHVVQFYEHEDDLVDLVVGYLAAAVGDGDAVVVIATPLHRAAFDGALAAAGLRPSALEREGRLMVLDADEALSRFMVSGTPDPDRFDAEVGGAIRALAAGGRPVRAYGEMVALLWEAGNRTGALELEGLWNGLGGTIPFSLFCAYPSRVVDEGTAAELCTLHSRVVGRAAASGATEVRAFARSQDAPRLTRRFVSATLSRWGLRELIDDAAIVVSELAANAVAHARSDLTLSLTRTRRGLRISVADGSSTPPAIRDAGPDAAGGRGLVLVQTIAERWGHAATDDGKVVWAELVSMPAGGR